MKIIYSGLESSGKSYKLATLAPEIALRNSKWGKKSGIYRPIASNLRFSTDFEIYCREDLGVPIQYWENLEELIKIENADVFMDEVGNYFDSRNWEDLSLDVKRWLTQGAKCGIEIYGTAQDFAQVDKAFRRLVNHLFHISKVIGSRRPSNTKPPVKYIWGLCMVKELDPIGYEEDKSKFKPINIIPTFFLLEKKFCEIFNTGQKILRSKPYPYRHIERDCELGFCADLPRHKHIIHA